MYDTLRLLSHYGKYRVYSSFFVGSARATGNRTKGERLHRWLQIDFATEIIPASTCVTCNSYCAKFVTGFLRFCLSLRKHTYARVRILSSICIHACVRLTGCEIVPQDLLPNLLVRALSFRCAPLVFMISLLSLFLFVRKKMRVARFKIVPQQWACIYKNIIFMRTPRDVRNIVCSIC